MSFDSRNGEVDVVQIWSSSGALIVCTTGRVASIAPFHISHRISILRCRAFLCQPTLRPPLHHRLESGIIPPRKLFDDPHQVMSRLLDLPLELREKILEHVVSDGTCKLNLAESQVSITYPVKFTNTFTTPWVGLAQTNKQLNTELNSTLVRVKPSVRGVGISSNGPGDRPWFPIYIMAQGFRIVHDINHDHSFGRTDWLPLKLLESGPDGVCRKRGEYIWSCSIDSDSRLIWTRGVCVYNMNVLQPLKLGKMEMEWVKKSLNI